MDEGVEDSFKFSFPQIDKMLKYACVTYTTTWKGQTTHFV